MATLGLRRLLVSRHKWLQPTTRFSISRTLHATSQWRFLVSNARFSTVNNDLANATAVKTEPTPSPLPDAVGSDGTTDWSKSYSGLSTQPFAKEIADVLMAPLDPLDVEIKPGELFSKAALKLCVLILVFRWFNLSS